jgi:glyoxylase-like metal-dependent hydrolase (beta-lactamase superfamily II)
MRRLLLFVLAVVVAAVAPFAAAFLPNAPLEHGRAYHFAHTIADGGFSGVYLLELPRGLVLVDAGNDPSAAAIDEALQRLGHQRSDVRAILLTHGHPDHTAGIEAFPEAKVYAHRLEADVLRGRATHDGPITALAGPAPHRRVDVEVDDRWSAMMEGVPVAAYHMPGHTRGSVAWWVDGLLFVGDSANVGHDGSLMRAMWVFSDDVDRNADSLRSLSERLAYDSREVDWILPSHSAAVQGIAPLEAW